MYKPNKSEPFTQVHVNHYVNLASEIPFPAVFSQRVINILEPESRKIGSSVEFILPPLLCSTGFYLSSATIHAFPNTTDSTCIYSALIANASSGKSGSIRLVKKAFSHVETYFEKDPNQSRIVCAPTVESLMDILSKLQSAIGFFDEAGTFFGSLGRYGAGNNNAAYDRSIYLMLWSAIDEIERDLKGDRSKIYFARYQLCLGTHPLTIINLLKNERNIFDDGFSHRFFLSCPPAPDQLSFDIRSTVTSKVTLQAIFLFLKIAHQTQRKYSFDKEAEKLTDSEFDLYKMYVKKANKFDSFLGALFGKAFFHLVRCSIIIKSLQEACNYLYDIKGANSIEIDQQFENRCREVVSNLPPSTFIIEKSVVEQARLLIDYFHMHKLVFASYQVDPKMSFREAIDIIFDENEQKPQISGIFTREKPNIIRLMRKILFYSKDSNPTASQIANGNDPVELVELAMRKLEEANLGSCSEQRSGNNRKYTTFNHISIEELTLNPELAITIQNLGCDLNKFKENLINFESQRELKEQNRLESKRKLSTSYQNEAANPNKKSKNEKLKTVVKLNKENGCPYTLNVSPSKINTHKQLKHTASAYPDIVDETDDESEPESVAKVLNPNKEKKFENDHMSESNIEDQLLLEMDIDFINNSTVKSKKIISKKSNYSNTSHLENNNLNTFSKSTSDVFVREKKTREISKNKTAQMKTGIIPTQKTVLSQSSNINQGDCKLKNKSVKESKIYKYKSNSMHSKSQYAEEESDQEVQESSVEEETESSENEVNKHQYESDQDQNDSSDEQYSEQDNNEEIADQYTNNKENESFKSKPKKKNYEHNN